jgi:CelD/BcsL family acetyltransferase involved in cellulose biosynthesis
MKAGQNVIQIDRIEDLEVLSDRWQEVYDADDEAHVFASWPWYRGFLGGRPRGWAVLVVRLGETPVAFWPVEPRTIRRLSVPVLRELHEGGGGIGDYCGLACDPAHRHEVVAALAEFLAGWDRVNLRDVRDGRIEQLATAMGVAGFERKDRGEVCCRVVDLPSDWETYLAETLGAKVRRNLRRSLRELEAAGVEIEEVEAGQLAERLEALLGLWQRRFGEVGPEYRAGLVATFSSCHRAGLAFLTVVKRDGAILAGVARFLDRKKQVAYELMNSFSAEFCEVHSPGQVVVALSVRHAIEQGCRHYDFLRGDEKYKEELGGRERACRSFEMEKKGIKSRAIGLAKRLRGRSVSG